MLEMIFIFALFFLACLYIYYKIVKKKGCSGCSSSKGGGCMSQQSACSSTISPKIPQENPPQAKNLQE